jgi:1-acyl-sn-glycerol-3-phosphate acyltransferase
MMKKGSIAIMPGVARMQLLAPIDPSKYSSREEILRAVYDAIAEALPEAMKPADHLINGL